MSGLHYLTSLCFIEGGDQLQVNSEEHLSEAQTQVSNLLMTRESIAVPYNEEVRPLTLSSTRTSGFCTACIH